MLTLAQTANARAKFAATFMISALTGDGVADVKRWLAAQRAGRARGTIPRIRSPTRRCGSSRPRSRARSSFSRLHQELPYQSTVETEQWKELRDGAVRIEQTIYVERESQRKIVLGKGGATIKAIGAEARRDIAEMVEAPVHLFLFVKVREHWADDPERYRDMGLEFPKD